MDKAKTSTNTSTKPNRPELGASSTKIDVYLAEVPIEGQIAVGQRFGLGKLKYGLNNWKNGNEWFILERITHLENHWLLFKRDGDKYDDNLGAVLWGCYVLKWYQANRPELYNRALSMIQGDKVYEFPKETSSDIRQGRGDQRKRGGRVPAVPGTATIDNSNKSRRGGK